MEAGKYGEIQEQNEEEISTTDEESSESEVSFQVWESEDGQVYYRCKESEGMEDKYKEEDRAEVHSQYSATSILTEELCGECGGSYRDNMECE